MPVLFAFLPFLLSLLGCLLASFCTLLGYLLTVGKRDGSVYEAKYMPVGIQAQVLMCEEGCLVGGLRGLALITTAIYGCDGKVVTEGSKAIVSVAWLGEGRGYKVLGTCDVDRPFA